MRVFKFLVLGGIQSLETISEKFYPITFLAGERQASVFGDDLATAFIATRNRIN